MKMKKTVILLMTLVFSLLPAVACSALSQTEDGISYDVVDGEVVIQGFNAVGSVFSIPEVIDGLPVTSVALYACRGNSAITKVIVPSSVKEIGDYAFDECDNLNSVIFKNGCKYIGRYAFGDCRYLSDVELPDTLSVIDDNAFCGCVRLGLVKIPKSLEKIGVDAFIGCESLRFDTRGNAAAEECAEIYSIPTSFTQTWTFTLIMLITVTAVLGGLLYFTVRVIRKKAKP